MALNSWFGQPGGYLTKAEIYAMKKTLCKPILRGRCDWIWYSVHGRASTFPHDRNKVIQPD